MGENFVKNMGEKRLGKLCKKNMGENFAKRFGWQKAWVEKSMGVTLWKSMSEKRKKKNTGENFVKSMGENVVKSMGDKTWVKKAWVKTL